MSLISQTVLGIWRSCDHASC